MSNYIGIRYFRKPNINGRNTLCVLPKAETVDRTPNPRTKTQHVPNQAVKTGTLG
ncbi:MAG: hypothetical protein LBE12_00065 [Planctomycetaceae bacterium]|nr:hypothetical protein [Planctomycetaceae bacterium]